MSQGRLDWYAFDVTETHSRTDMEALSPHPRGDFSRRRVPRRALRKLLERDQMFTEMLREETARLGLCAIEVDTRTTENDLVGRVMKVFEL